MNEKKKETVEGQEDVLVLYHPLVQWKERLLHYLFLYNTQPNI